MLRVRAEGLCFAFCDAAPLIEDASFVLDTGFTGLVGPNGAGKTTLLRLIQKELAATAGALSVEPPAATVASCAQEVRAASHAVSAFAGSEGRLARRLRGVLHLRDFERWDTLSPGERKR